MRSHRLARRHFRSRARSGSRGIQRVRTQAFEGRRCVEQNCTHNTTGLYCQGRLQREWLPSLAEATERWFLPCGTWSAPPLRSSLAAESDFHHSPSGAAETTLHSTQASACGRGPFNRSRARWVGLDRFIFDFPWWPTHCPVTEELCSLQTLAVNRAEGCWDVLSKAWLSLLAVPGILLKRKGHSWAGLMLSSNHFGTSRILWPLNKIGTTWMLDSSLGAGSIVFDIIREHKDWNGMQIDRHVHPNGPVLPCWHRSSVSAWRSQNQCWGPASNWASQCFLLPIFASCSRRGVCRAYQERNRGWRWRCPLAFPSWCCTLPG